MAQGIRETVGWVLSFAVLVVLLYAVDGRIRHRLSQLGRDVMTVRWSDQLNAWGDAMGAVVRSQGLEGGLLATFLVVSLLLVWLMLRT